MGIMWSRLTGTWPAGFLGRYLWLTCGWSALVKGPNATLWCLFDFYSSGLHMWRCVTYVESSTVQMSPDESRWVWRNPTDCVGQCKVLAWPMKKAWYLSFVCFPSTRIWVGSLDHLVLLWKVRNSTSTNKLENMFRKYNTCLKTFCRFQIGKLWINSHQNQKSMNISYFTSAKQNGKRDWKQESIRKHILYPIVQKKRKDQAECWQKAMGCQAHCTCDHCDPWIWPWGTITVIEPTLSISPCPPPLPLNWSHTIGFKHYY